MMTLSIRETSMPQEENAALLSSCHGQISLPGCSFLQQAGTASKSGKASFRCGRLIDVLDLFSRHAM
jgi:hypothetical protein